MDRMQARPTGAHRRHTGLLAPLALLAACATPAGLLPPGTPVAQVLQRLGPPTAEHPRDDGGKRLEYSAAPFGRHTTMVDVDAQGRVLQVQQVLDPAHFDAIRPGLDRAALLYRLGQPARVWAVRYRGQTVWSWRWAGGDCQLFHVGLSPAGLAEDSSYGPDPLCERREPFGR